jgi:hypothetical protein
MIVIADPSPLNYLVLIGEVEMLRRLGAGGLNPEQQIRATCRL